MCLDLGRNMLPELPNAGGSSSRRLISPASFTGLLRTAATEVSSSRWSLLASSGNLSTTSSNDSRCSLVATPSPGETAIITGGGPSPQPRGHLAQAVTAGGALAVPRLLPCSGTGVGIPADVGTSLFSPSSAGEWFQLRPRPRGSLGALVPEPMGLEAARAALPPGGLLVAVQAVGINFRDVLNVSAQAPWMRLMSVWMRTLPPPVLSCISSSAWVLQNLHLNDLTPG